jgi:hypothetical protein
VDRKDHAPTEARRSKTWEMKLLNRLNKVILAALAPLPIIGEPIRALNVYHKIKSLEKLERFEQARIVSW